VYIIGSQERSWQIGYHPAKSLSVWRGMGKFWAICSFSRDFPCVDWDPRQAELCALHCDRQRGWLSDALGIVLQNLLVGSSYLFWVHLCTLLTPPPWPYWPPEQVPVRAVHISSLYPSSGRMCFFTLLLVQCQQKQHY